MRRALLISSGLHVSLLAALLLGRAIRPARVTLAPPPRTVQVEVVRDPGSEHPGAPTAQPAKPAAKPAPALPPAPKGSEPVAAPTAPPQPAPPPVRLGEDAPGLTDDVLGPKLVPPGRDPSKQNLPPRYPVEAARRGEEGTVRLLVDIAASGVPETVAIQSSSGSASLDEAARAAVLTWHFTPAMRDGHPIGAEIPYVFNFCISCRDRLTSEPR